MPATAITVAQTRSPDAIARDIQRRLLPAMHDILVRARDSIRQRGDLFVRRERAVDELRRLCPGLYRHAWSQGGAPALSLAPALALDLRIEDSDRIAVTRWSDLDLETAVRVVAMVLDHRSHDTKGDEQ